MAREYIEREDLLNQGRVKLNKSIDKSYDAEANSLDAKNIANQSTEISNEAKDIAANTDERLDNIVAGEMKDGEVIDFRHSQMLGHTFDIIEKRGNFWDKHIRKLGAYPEWYGAIGDGVTDDTDAIQQCFNENDVINFSQGKTYLIDAEKMINVRFNQVINQNNATLKVKATSNGSYTVYNLDYVNNVVFNDVKLVGDRYEHFDESSRKIWKQWQANTFYEEGDMVYSWEVGMRCAVAGTSGTTRPVQKTGTITDGTCAFEVVVPNVGEYGFGFDINDCENVTLNNVRTDNFWGDGIIIRATGSEAIQSTRPVASKNIKITNHVASSCRRQGISVISAINLTIDGVDWNNISGTSPEAGIDFEPNWPWQRLENIVLNNIRTNGNSGAGILYAPANLDDSSKPVSITIDNHNDFGSMYGSKVTSVIEKDKTVKGQVMFNNSIYSHNQASGIYGLNYGVKEARVEFNDLKIINPNEMGMKKTSGSGIVFTRNVDGAIAGNFHVNRFEIVDNRKEKLMYAPVFIQSQSPKTTHIDNISLIDPINITQGKNDNAYGLGTIAHTNHLVLSDIFKTITNEAAINTYIATGYTYSNIVANNVGDIIIVRVDLSDINQLPVGYEFEVNVKHGAGGARIVTNSSQIILPIGNGAGKYIQTFQQGARVKLRKMTSASWQIVEMVGTWISET